MTTKTKLSIAAAAMSGLLAGTVKAGTLNSAPATFGIHASSVKVVRTAAAHPGTRTLDDNDKGKHDCKGKNDCKGAGGCKTGDQGCKGKNSCKGKGGCKTDGPATQQ